MERITVEMGGERKRCVLVGKMGWDSDYNSEHVPHYHKQPHGKVLTWDDARPLLDYEFDEGFGSPECNSIYAWTDSYVIAVSKYDGSTSPFRIPRNPTDVLPEMPGGG